MEAKPALCRIVPVSGNDRAVRASSLASATKQIGNVRPGIHDRCNCRFAELALVHPAGGKVRAGQSTRDLSLHTLATLTTGLLLWIVYGAIKADWIIVSANLVGTCLTGFVLYRKLREIRSQR